MLGLHVEVGCTSLEVWQFLGDNIHEHTITVTYMTREPLVTMTGMYLGIIHKAARTVHTGRLSMSIHGFWHLAYMLHTCTQYVLNT